MKAQRQQWETRARRLGELIPVARLHPGALAGAVRPRREPWVVAFSGGADSLALLLLLWAHWPERRAQLSALHFNHGLRGAAADRDEAYCRKVCRALGIAFSSGRRRRRAGTALSEAEAREARFAFFERKLTAAGARLLWLGQQQNDVAETLLMRLARGSGAGGLAAPRPLQKMPGGRIHVRPLLTLKHEELTGALRLARIPWREDASNAGGDFFRNRVRNTVLPAWSEAAGRDALAGAALSRSLLEEDDAALEQWVDGLAALDRKGKLDLTKLANAPRAVVRRALHRWLLRHPVAAGLSRQGFELLLAKTILGAPTRFSLGVTGFAVIRRGILFFEQGATRRSASSGHRL